MKGSENMYCAKCGTKIETGAKFCTSCGSKILESITDSVNDIVGKEFLFKVMGEGKATIRINENSITISRPGAISKLTHGFVGDKTIMLNQITSVQFKKSTTFTTGFLQFIVPGTIEAKKSKPLERVKDENIVYFKDPWGNYANENKIAQSIKEYIENYNLRQNQPQQIIKKDSNLDEIRKLKELLDMGAISQEEFNKKKKDLLNL